MTTSKKKVKGILEKARDLYPAMGKADVSRAMDVYDKKRPVKDNLKVMAGRIPISSSGLQDVKTIIAIEDAIGEIPQEKIGGKNGRVTRLDLSLTSFSDADPLKHLEALREINLRGTDVYDITPLKELEHLRKLDLVCTNAYNITPLKKMEGLEEVRLSWIDVHGPIWREPESGKLESEKVVELLKERGVTVEEYPMW